LPDGLNLRHVYYFHAVAVESSIAGASRRLGVSQSTISEQLKALEEFFGGVLFERRKGGLMLTPAGERVFEHSQNIFKAARRMLQDLKPDLDRRAWVLEVGVSPASSRTFATGQLFPLFGLHNVFPRVRLGTNGALVEDLLRGELDLVISENAVTDGQRGKVGSQTLRQHPLEVVASPDLAS
jgi:molybdate transport repressor ModE-like protein